MAGLRSLNHLGSVGLNDFQFANIPVLRVQDVINRYIVEIVPTTLYRHARKGVSSWPANSDPNATVVITVFLYVLNFASFQLLEQLVAT
jgi:hypothetical protein